MVREDAPLRPGDDNHRWFEAILRSQGPPEPFRRLLIEAHRQAGGDRDAELDILLRLMDEHPEATDLALTQWLRAQVVSELIAEGYELDQEAGLWWKLAP